MKEDDRMMLKRKIYDELLQWKTMRHTENLKKKTEVRRKSTMKNLIRKRFGSGFLV